jgi:hypothetical protein
MKKILFTLILIAPFFASASPYCTSWHIKEFKTGVLKDNDKLLRNDCSCHCNGPRTEKNICLECGHGHSETLLETIHTDLNDLKDYAVDLITTTVGNKKN